LGQARGLSPRIAGPAVSETSFTVQSRLDADFTPSHTFANDLGEVLDFFLDSR
jgi:hypothetical protein